MPDMLATSWKSRRLRAALPERMTIALVGDKVADADVLMIVLAVDAVAIALPANRNRPRLRNPLPRRLLL